MVNRDFESWERDHKTWSYFVKIREFLLKRLFWVEILYLMIEAEFEMLIAGYLQMKDPLTTTWGELFSSFLAFCGTVVSIVAFPGAIIYMLRQDVDVLSETRFEKTWGPIYEGLRMKSKWTLAYYLVYTVRRIIYIFIVFYITQNGWQLVLLQYLNGFVIIYQLMHKPLDSQLKNRIEFVNEIFISTLTFFMCFFTDYIPSHDV